MAVGPCGGKSIGGPSTSRRCERVKTSAQTTAKSGAHFRQFCPANPDKQQHNPAKAPVRPTFQAGAPKPPSTTSTTTEEEDFPKLNSDRAAFRVGRHDVDSVLPPSLANLGRGDGCPWIPAFDFGMAEESPCFGMEEDRVVQDAVAFERLPQFRPVDLPSPVPSCCLPPVLPCARG